jgi:hypothetical protein
MNRRIDGFHIIKVALATAVISVFGWMVFNGFRTMFSLDTLPPIASIGIGVGGIYLAYRFGFKKED